MTSRSHVEQLLWYAESLRQGGSLLGLKIEEQDKRGLKPNHGVLATLSCVNQGEINFFAVDALEPQYTKRSLRIPKKRAIQTVMFHAVTLDNASKQREQGHSKDDQYIRVESLALQSGSLQPCWVEHSANLGRKPDGKAMSYKDYLVRLVSPFAGNYEGRNISPGEWLAATAPQVESFYEVTKTVQEAAAQRLLLAATPDNI